MTSRKFTVPAPDKIPNPSTETDPVDVQERIAQLPYADLRNLARTLLGALTLLNRHPHKVGGREQIMAAYQAPCARLVRVHPDRPGSPSSQQMRQLMVEMAYGYKHLLNDALRTSNWLKNRKALTQALYFAAKYLSLELFLSFESYECKASNSWRELMAVYRLAEERDLHNAPVEDKEQAGSANASIAHVFKRIILLRLQDPCHMVSGEARACFDYLNLIASHAELKSPADVEAHPGRYLLDLDGLDTPQPLARGGRPDNPERYRCLNLFPVSQQVHRHLQDMERNDAAPPEGLQRMRELGPKLVLKRILLAWHGQHSRRNERDEAFGWLTCALGLSAVHHFLGENAAAAEEEQADEEIVELADASGLARRPVRYLRIRCRQVNRSRSGICLHLQLPSELKPKVGQLLLMQSEHADGSESSQVGIVRRRLRIDTATLEAGIHLIQGRVLPIGLRVAGQESDFQAGLWVERGEPRMNSILGPPGHFATGQELELQPGSPAQRLILQDCVEETPSFVRFRFSL